MRPYLKISGAIFLMLASATVSTVVSARQQLTPAQINQYLIGKELTGKVFAFNTTALYSRDGRVRVKTPFGDAKGRWVFSKTGLCVNITSGPRKGKTCMTVDHLGKGLFQTSEGNKFRIKN